LFFFPKEGGSSLVVFSIPARGVLIGSKKWQNQKPARFQNLITNFTGLFFRQKKMAEKVLWDFWAKVLWGFWKVVWGFWKVVLVFFSPQRQSKSN